ncbi:MAG: ribokinase [Acetobacteraceae bacterium]|nr:ribokinase [Acetobacteraceae bacterium]
MIVCFGSVNLDLIFALPHLPAAGETVLAPAMTIEPGGKGANQAVAAARDGAHVVFAGAVGTDALANDALRLMRAANMDTSRIAVAQAATGCAAICVDPAGRNFIAVASGANLAARHAQVEAALLGPGTTVLLQMEVPRAEIEALVRRARAAGCRIVLNVAPAAPLDEAALRAVDILVANEGEASFLGELLGCGADAAALNARLGVDVVLTLGERGVEAATAGGVVHLAAHPVDVVDTTGAGDCFTGVLAAALDRGLALPAALARANLAAGLCCTRPGTQGSMPMAAQTSAAIRK